LPGFFLPCYHYSGSFPGQLSLFFCKKTQVLVFANFAFGFNFYYHIVSDS